MTRCGFNECPHGVVKRRIDKYGPNCRLCDLTRRELARGRKSRYRLRCDVGAIPEEYDSHEYSELGDYILRRDAAGNLLPPEPKPGRPPFIEVELSEQ